MVNTDLAPHRSSPKSNLELIRRLVLASVVQLGALMYVILSYRHQDWSFGWLGFATIFGLIALFNSLVISYAWRKRHSFRPQAQTVIIDWATAWIWFGVFGPLYQLLAITLDNEQLKVDAIAYLWGVIIFGSFVYFATQVTLKPVFKYMQTGETDDPLGIYKIASRFPLRVALRNTSVAVFGYVLGSVQMHYMAGLPRIEFYKNLGVGLVLSLFMSIFYYMVYTTYLGRVKSKLIEQYRLESHIKPRYSFNVIATVVMVTLGSMFLSTLIFVRSFQTVVEHNVTSLVQQRMGSLKDIEYLEKEPTFDDLRFGARGVVFISPVNADFNTVSPGVVVSTKTAMSFAHPGERVIRDNAHDPKLIAYKDFGSKRVVSVVYLNDYYDVFSKTYQMLVGSGMFIVAATIIVMSLFARTVGLTINKLNKSVRHAQRTGQYHDPGINSGDELEMLSRTFGKFVDQTNLQNTQIKQEHARLHASIAGLQLGFIMTDTEGKILEWNNSASQIIYDRSSNIPQSLASIADSYPGTSELLDRLVAALKDNDRPKKFSVTFGARYLDVLTAPINSEGVFLGLVILLQDVTEGQVLSRSKDEFFSIASHELRTPLTVIRGNSSMMLQMYETVLSKHPDMRNMITDMHHASTGLIEIVNDFLDVSKLEQGKMVFTSSPVDAVKEAEQVVHDLRVLADQKHIKLTLTKGKQIPIVHADAGRVKQVLYNLIGNALKFTESGSVSVEISYDTKSVIIKVTDTGRGISPDNQKLLFRKFQQAGSSILTRDATRGTGLGLYISRLMIQKMGGKLTLASSKLGEGSTFRLTLPLYRG